MARVSEVTRFDCVSRANMMAAIALRAERVSPRKVTLAGQWFVFSQPNIPLFKPIESPETLSRDSYAPPEKIVLTWRNATGPAGGFEFDGN